MSDHMQMENDLDIFRGVLKSTTTFQHIFILKSFFME